MKIRQIYSYDTRQNKINKSNIQFEGSIIDRTKKFLKKCALVTAPLALMTLSSCGTESGKPKDGIEITKGKVENRSDAEIEKMTGLNPIQFEIAKKLMLDEINYSYSEIYGKLYFKDSEYQPCRKNLLINFTNGEKERSFYYAKIGNVNAFVKCDLWGSYNEQSTRLQVIHEADGNFSILLKGWHGDLPTKTRIYNFTRDGKIKDQDYLPKYLSNLELEQQQKEEEQAKVQEENQTYTDISNIDLFKNKDKKNIAKFINALGLKNVEYINENGGHVFFLEGDNCSYKLNISSMEDDPDTFIGVANKVTSDGESEIYIIKAELVSTDKSDKVIIQRMEVVKDGFDAEMYKKDKTVTTKTGRNTSSTKYNVDLNTKQYYPIFQILKNFGSWEKFHEGNINSKTLSSCYETITESNADGVTFTIVSIDKETGNTTVQGNVL